MKKNTILATVIIASAMLLTSSSLTYAQNSSIDTTAIAQMSQEEITIEEISSRIDDIEDSIDEINDNIKKLSHSKDSKYFDISEDIKEWLMLIVCVICLPGVLIYLYINNEKRKERKYDTLIDLIRSGAEIKPELLPYITGNNFENNIITSGIGSGLNENDVNYCSKKLLWGVAIILLGLLLGILSNEEEVFLIIGFCGLIPILQAVVRYLNVSYIVKHSSKKHQNTEKENAE